MGERIVTPASLRAFLGRLPHHKEHSGPLLTGLPDPGEEGPGGLPDPEDLDHLNGGALGQMDHWGPPLSPILMGEMRPRGRTQHSGHLLAGCPDPGEGGFAGLQDPEVLDHIPGELPERPVVPQPGGRGGPGGDRARESPQATNTPPSPGRGKDSSMESFICSILNTIISTIGTSEAPAGTYHQPKLTGGISAPSAPCKALAVAQEAGCKTQVSITRFLMTTYDKLPPKFKDHDFSIHQLDAQNFQHNIKIL